MIIEVPYIYRVKALMGKKRRVTETFHVRGSVPVKIEEPTDDVVFAGKIPLEDGPYVLRADLLHWDDSFWVNVVEDVSDDNPAAFFEASALAAHVAKGSENAESISLSVVDRWDAKDAKASLADIGASTITESDEAGKVSAIEARAASLMILEGKIFRRVSEPVYVTARRPENLLEVQFIDNVRPIPDEPLQGHRRNNESIWRADKLDRMLASFEWRKPLGEDQRARAESMRMEIYRPDLLSWDRERDNCLDKCHRLVSGASKLERGSKELMIDFADARDSMVSYKDAGFDLHQMVEAVGRLVLRCKTDDPKGDMFGSYLVERAERAINEWLEIDVPSADLNAIADMDFTP